MTTTQGARRRELPGANEGRGHEAEGGPGRRRDVVPFWVALTVTVGLLPWLGDLPPLQGALSVSHAALAAAGVARAAYPVLRPIALVTFVFTFSWLGVAPIYQLSTGRAAWRDNAVLFGPNTTPALLLALLATGALYIGFFRGGPAGGAPDGSRSSNSLLAPPRALCLSYLIACLVLTPSAVAAAGGISGLFSSRNERR